MKIFSLYNLPNVFCIFISLITLSNFRTNYLYADELLLKEIEIDSSTKFDEKSSDFPTNPFEIVEMIRRANSLNDATIPSDAIDDALKSFNMVEEKEKI